MITSSIGLLPHDFRQVVAGPQALRADDGALRGDRPVGVSWGVIDEPGQGVAEARLADQRAHHPLARRPGPDDQDPIDPMPARAHDGDSRAPADPPEQQQADDEDERIEEDRAREVEGAEVEDGDDQRAETEQGAADDQQRLIEQAGPARRGDRRRAQEECRQGSNQQGEEGEETGESPADDAAIDDDIPQTSSGKPIT